MVEDVRERRPEWILPGVFDHEILEHAEIVFMYPGLPQSRHDELRFASGREPNSSRVNT